MLFSKNEVIELNGGTKYIIVDITEYEKKYFYYIIQVDEYEKHILDNRRIITIVSEGGKYFIKSVKGELLNELFNIFDAK